MPKQWLKGQHIKILFKTIVLKNRWDYSMNQLYCTEKCGRLFKGWTQKSLVRQLGKWCIQMESKISHIFWAGWFYPVDWDAPQRLVHILSQKLVPECNTSSCLHFRNKKADVCLLDDLNFTEKKITVANSLNINKRTEVKTQKGGCLEFNQEVGSDKKSSKLVPPLSYSLSQ